MNCDDIKMMLVGKTIFFEAIKDASGTQGISLSYENSGKLEHHYIINDMNGDFKSFVHDIIGKNDKICWDARNWNKLQQEHELDSCDIIDVSFYYREVNLIRAAGANLTDDEVDEINRARRKLGSHVKACRTAKIDLKRYSLQDVVPNDVLVNYYRMRNDVLYTLWKKIPEQWKESFAVDFYPKIAAYYDIENRGIFVNANIEYDEESSGNKRFISDIIKRVNNEYNAGIVYTGFNLTHTTKTGRVHPVKNTFGCMNIPKTMVRRAIISSKDNGMIASIDMNAADYRCIIAALDNPLLNSIYDDCIDFHDKTVEYIFGVGKSTKVRRDVVKRITYTMIYGGSIEKLSKQTGLKEETVKLILKKLEPISKPINDFSTKLFSKSMSDGFVTDLLKSKIPLNRTEHRGQVLALYAQSCCSKVFTSGVVELHRFLKNTNSRLLFTVHDEVVIDVDESDVGLVKKMKDKLELGSSKMLGAPLVAKAKIGKNYWDIE